MELTLLFVPATKIREVKQILVDFIPDMFGGSDEDRVLTPILPDYRENGRLLHMKSISRETTRVLLTGEHYFYSYGLAWVLRI